MSQAHHRSRPRLRDFIPRRAAAAAVTVPLQIGTVKDRQVYTSVSTPRTIERGHQLRAAICPVCGLIASDQLVRLVQTATMTLHSDGKGDLLCRAFMVHDHHWPLTEFERDLVARWATGWPPRMGFRA